MKLIEDIDLGNTVLCDYCNEDYTESKECGGIIFGSHAICPKCADRALITIKECGEEEYIKALCGPDQSFGDFVRKYRGPDGGHMKMYSY